MINIAIDSTPLRVTSDGKTNLMYHLRYNYRAMRLFEERAGLRSFDDFFVNFQKNGCSARELIALLWAGLEGYQPGQVAIETVEEWLNFGNQGDFLKVCFEAINKARGPDSVPAKKNTESQSQPG